MSLSSTPTTNNPTSPAKAQHPFSWIEHLAIPITLSAMEAQPLALLVILATQLFVGSNTPPLGAGGIMLLELGLMWWAMLVEYLTRRVFTKNSANTLLIVGWAVALAILIGPGLLQGQSIVQALIVLILITWLWRRGIAHGQRDFEYNSVALPFKVGFGIILGALFLVTILPGLPSLRAALPTALPIFFLSGLIAVSLARLGTLRAARIGTDEAHTDPTRSWLLALAIFGSALIVLVIIIESIFSFSTLEAVVTALAPLWNAIGTIVNWLLYGLVFLLSPIFYFISFIVGLLRGTPAKPIQLPGSPIQNRTAPGHNTQAIIAQFISIGRWVLLALILLAILIIVVRTMQRWLSRNDDEGVEEIRESLDARSLLMQRLRAWLSHRRRQTEAEIALEPLDPLSARARYRELLQEVALASEVLARKPVETPGEYKMRLNASVREQPRTAQEIGDEGSPTIPEMLEMLTHAYEDERYGGRPTSAAPQERWRHWIPRLIAQLTGNIPRRRTRS